MQEKTLISQSQGPFKYRHVLTIGQYAFQNYQL